LRTFRRAVHLPHAIDQKGFLAIPTLRSTYSKVLFFDWIVTFLLLALCQGITTYEYVVAIRDMSEVPQDEEEEERVNIIYSPTNSATTGFSAGSSLGLHYKGAWCTPPRIFVDQVALDDEHTAF
jgi:hypothetical protein